MLRIATVDNFRGEEAKVIVLTTVRSGGRPGFLKTANRINVACSRARNGFYIIGNSETLRQVPMWKAIVDVCARRNRIGPFLRTCCNRHPQNFLDIHSPEDFGAVQDCQIPCNKLLRRGHPCEELCHPFEIHDRIPCQKPCQKKLNCGHVCGKLCHEDCGPCEYALDQQTLPCGHQAEMLCSGKVPPCYAISKEVQLPCGHTLTLKCADKHEDLLCEQHCRSLLGCGHACQGLCADCFTHDHPPCAGRCDREQPCGHFCSSTCHEGDACPPCDQPCFDKCFHGPCRNRCAEACEPCFKPHKPTCDHQQESSMICSLPSDVLPCSKHCQAGTSILSYQIYCAEQLFVTDFHIIPS
jgi:hypothetical protein